MVEALVHDYMKYHKFYGDSGCYQYTWMNQGVLMTSNSISIIKRVLQIFYNFTI